MLGVIVQKQREGLNDFLNFPICNLDVSLHFLSHNMQHFS